MIPVISFVGSSNSGKTTYLEKLIPALKKYGLKVAVIKHDVHGFEIDIPGKDTWRHAQAGADIVCISSWDKMAIIEKVDNETALEEIVKKIKDVDIILTEGYKREGKNKVEVIHNNLTLKPVCTKDELIAVVACSDIYNDLPCFPVNDADPMASFILERFFKKSV